MPSLNALGEFRASFNDIGNERNNLQSKNLPFDDLALPDTEAVPFEPPGQPASPSGDFAPESEPGQKDETPSSAGSGDFDFSAFLNTLPGEISPPPIEDILPADDFPVDQSAGDFSVPDDLLSGLSDEIESAPPDFVSEDLGGELPDFDLGGESPQTSDLDLGGELPDFDLGGESAETGDLDLGGELPDFDLGGESAETGDLDLGGELPDFDLGSESPETGDLDLGGKLPDFDLGGESAETGDLDLGGELPDFDLGGESAETGNLDPGDELPDFDFPETGAAADTGSGVGIDHVGKTVNLGGEKRDGTFTRGGDDLDLGSDDADGGLDAISFDSGDGLPDFDIPGIDDSGELPDFMSEDLGLGDSPDDPLASDLDADAVADDAVTDADAAAEDDGTFGDADFALSGLDELFDKTKTETAPKPAAKKSFFRRAKVEDLPEPEEIEEIQLSEEDLKNFRKTLSGYPLNLRIACEELIAEQVLTPQQLSKLVRLLVNGAPAKETAALAGQISGKTIVIPKSFAKSSGAELEAEQASFAYIFVHNFLPVLRLFAVIAALAASIVYLGYKFIYTPFKAESLYKRGYERIFAGEYQRANGLFNEAFATHRKKTWFYKYAEGFRDERRYMFAEEKYDELLRYYPRDKRGVLDYASLETNYLMNYDKANRLLLRELIDYAPNDPDGLLAYGDNNLAWADSDPSRYADKYEDARFAYARLLEKYGWKDPVVERMMKYFIRTDNLKEVLPLKAWFDYNSKRQLSPPALAELGGYLLDKQLEEVKGVPNAYIESIEGVRAMLLQAVRADLNLPEPHYHLARYYKNLGNIYEERLTLENAIRAYDLARDESVRRRLNRVDAHYRYASLLTNNREFFPAEEQLVRGIELYEDFLTRNLVSSSPQLGKLYAARGDLEYFVKTGNTQAALNYYHRSEQNGWAPPEIQYRMGAAYYQQEDWKNSLEYLFKASADLPLNRRLLFALGNVTYKRGDYYAAQGYYNRLLDILENQRSRLPVLLPNDRPDFLDVGERLMIARNNAGVVYEALADQTGSRDYRSRALFLYAESSRAWDSITRSPESMVRMRPAGTPGAPGINLGFLNANNALHSVNARRPADDYKPEIFIRIDKDVLEPSHWEELAPMGGLTN